MVRTDHLRADVVESEDLSGTIIIVGIRFHVRHDDGLVAGFAVPCTFSHSNFAGSRRMFVLVSCTEFSVMSSHGAIGSQLNVPTSACCPLPEIFWNVIALSLIDVLPSQSKPQNCALRPGAGGSVAQAKH